MKTEINQAPAKFRLAPFPYFGGKRTIADAVWQRLGQPKQYIEPFCGSAAMLLLAPKPASLEVIGDLNYYIADFWRALKHQPDAVCAWQDYPVSHVDLAARHRWLTEPERTAALSAALQDPDWPGDPKIAGWWVWGQCSWIGPDWCEKPLPPIPHLADAGRGVQSQIPHLADAGRGVQSQIPHLGSAGRGVQSKIPHLGSAGRGVQSKIPHLGGQRSPHKGLQSPDAAGVAQWLKLLSARLARVRILHADWTRTLYHYYGGLDTAIFLDPPYRGFEGLYGATGREPVADAVSDWARAHPELRIALCGLCGDYNLPGWATLDWTRARLTYGSAKTTKKECVWFSPACAPLKVES